MKMRDAEFSNTKNRKWKIYRRKSVFFFFFWEVQTKKFVLRRYTGLRGTILNRTYDTHKNLHISLFVLSRGTISK